VKPTGLTIIFYCNCSDVLAFLQPFARLLPLILHSHSWNTRETAV
jgi:hypothetical protein